MTNKKRVIIVDDQDVLREGLRHILNGTDSIEVVAEAANGKEFLDLVGKTAHDVILMDINMPVMNGVEATRQAVSANPDLRILALSMFGEDDNYFKMLQAGARGFVLKTSVVSELVKAISEVAENGYYTSEELIGSITGKHGSKEKNAAEEKKVLASLSPNELKTLKLISMGLSDEEIAKKQKTGVAAARSQRAGLMTKTNCNNSASLTMFAVKYNVTDIK
jgi:DNA-binding NarL/FixJ family response regulator